MSSIGYMNISITNASTDISDSCFNLSRGARNITKACPVSLIHQTPPFDRNLFKIFLVIIYSFIFLIGVPGNTLIILTIVRVPKMRSVKNLLIANIAIGDLVSLLWCLTNALLGLFVTWPYGENVCKYLNPLSDVIIGNAVFTMVMISIERYRAIITPFLVKLTLRKTVFAIIILWMLSYLFIGVPLLRGTGIKHGGFWVKKVCSLSWTNRVYELIYRLGTFFCVFLIPFCIILYCFVQIKYQLEENIRFAKKSLRGRNTLKRAKNNQRLIKMLLVIFLSFTTCFLPVNILLLSVTFFREALFRWKYLVILFQLAIAVLFLNSTMNPIILYLLSKDFRKGYLQQLQCLCPSNVRLQRAVDGIRRMSTYSFRLSSTHKNGNEKSIILLPTECLSGPLPPSNENIEKESLLCVKITNEEGNGVSKQKENGDTKSSQPMGDPLSLLSLVEQNNSNNNTITQSTKQKKVSWSQYTKSLE